MFVTFDLLDGVSSVPKLCVIVPHYNDLAGLDRCLRALEAQTLPRECYDIVVGDNDSPQGESAVRATIASRAQLVIQPMRGAGPARNAAVEESNSPILAFIDSDCVAEPQWLEAGMAALQDYDVVGGQVKVLVEHDGPMTGAEAFESVFAFDNESYVLKKGFTGSGNLFCTRSTFDKVGGFLVGVSEDRDWSQRATALGFRLGYCRDAAIGHPARTNWIDLRRKWERVNAETYGLIKQRPFANIVWLGRTWLLPLSILVHASRVIRSPALRNNGDRIAALLMLGKIRLWRFWHCHQLLFRELFSSKQ